MIRVDLPWKSPPLTGNDRGPTHGFRAAKVARTLSEAATVVRAANLEPAIGAEVSLHWRIPDRRRRDSDNLAPTLKVCLDALVRTPNARGECFLPDDSWIHVPRTGQEIHPPEPGREGAMWLQIRVLGAGE